MDAFLDAFVVPGAFILLIVDANDAGSSSQTYTGSDGAEPGTPATGPALSTDSCCGRRRF